VLFEDGAGNTIKQNCSVFP